MYSHTRLHNFRTSKLTSQDIDNLLKNRFQKIQVAREDSGKTDRRI
jgi:hypothetical protein